AGELQDRLRVSPAGVGRLDHRVDEQRERAGDRERAEGVVASLGRRRATLAHEEGGERERCQADRDVDEEDPLPAGAVDERAADEPGGGGADPSERAPYPERLVALSPLLEGRGDDRERTRRHD